MQRMTIEQAKRKLLGLMVSLWDHPPNTVLDGTEIWKTVDELEAAIKSAKTDTTQPPQITDFDTP